MAINNVKISLTIHIKTYLKDNNINCHLNRTTVNECIIELTKGDEILVWIRVYYYFCTHRLIVCLRFDTFNSTQLVCLCEANHQ